jgi:hypothetical protein
MSKSKLLIIYVCLVGFPLLGLLAILHAGERLTPPKSLGGAWNLEADFSSLATKSCRDLLSNVKQPFLSISQSGPSLALTLNNSQRTTLPGTLQNTNVIAGPDSAMDTSGDSEDCGDPRAIQLRADISKDAGERTLIGTLSIAGCPHCAPIPFRAQRQSSSSSEGR